MGLPMLSNQDNDLLTKVGPGTAMGMLLRRYWHPIATINQLDEEPVRSVRLLGEDLVLYRDRSGTLGLIAQRCLHRGVNLACGIPESQGLRCPYHGWLFNQQGRCLERPFEDQQAQPGSETTNQKLRIQSYPVCSVGGLIFAYLGPEPIPICPDWGDLERENIYKEVRIGLTPCNWFQVIENAMDPVHHEWLHGHFSDYASERQNGTKKFKEGDLGKWVHQRIDFEHFCYGIHKRRMFSAGGEASQQWIVGTPMIFPNLAWFRNRIFWRVPVDDTHTLNVIYIHRPLAEDERASDMPIFAPDPTPSCDEGYRVDWSKASARSSTHFQDQIAWMAQGPIADRSRELLGHSDQGIKMLRKLFFEEVEKCRTGEKTMNVFHRQEEFDLSRIHCAPTLGATAPLSLNHVSPDPPSHAGSHDGTSAAGSCPA